MATPEEIERRVEEADSARSARRSAAAKRLGELAQHRAAIAEQLADIERDLGDVLVECSDVIDIDELARFTDLPVSDLTRWREARKTNRPRKKKPAARAAGAQNDTSRRQSAPGTPTTGHASKPPEPAVTRVDTVNAPEPVAADVS
jgi:hypothetical protein